ALSSCQQYDLGHYTPHQLSQGLIFENLAQCLSKQGCHETKRCYEDILFPDGLIRIITPFKTDPGFTEKIDNRSIIKPWHRRIGTAENGPIAPFLCHYSRLFYVSANVDARRQHDASAQYIFL